jgi:hypothetical protein
MGRGLAIALLAAALLFVSETAASAQDRPTIVARPAILRIELGHSRIIDTTIEHGGIAPRMRWELLPPGIPGEIWGWLNQNGRYTAPPQLPPGEVRIVVHLLNQYGRPTASAVIPVVFH